jgi:hypothetical protein
MIPRRKSWADRQAIPTGVWGELVNNIPIREDNRASVWEFRKDGISTLLNIMRSQYRDKGVNCTMFGIDDGKSIKYAIFVQPGFLKKVTEVE